MTWKDYQDSRMYLREERFQPPLSSTSLLRLLLLLFVSGGDLTLLHTGCGLRIAPILQNTYTLTTTLRQKHRQGVASALPPSYKIHTHLLPLSGRNTDRVWPPHCPHPTKYIHTYYHSQAETQTGCGLRIAPILQNTYTLTTTLRQKHRQGVASALPPSYKIHTHLLPLSGKNTDRVWPPHCPHPTKYIHAYYHSQAETQTGCGLRIAPILQNTYTLTTTLRQKYRQGATLVPNSTCPAGQADPKINLPHQHFHLPHHSVKHCAD